MEIYKNIDDVKYWKNKYNPQKIEDLDINPDIVQKIKKWLNDFDKNKKKYFEKNNNKKNTKNILKEESDIKDDIDLKDDLDLDNDIIISDKQINDPQKNCMILTGTHGCGKTATVLSILKSLNYSIYNINFTKLNNNKNIGEIIEKTIFNKSITNRLNSIKDNNKILLIDNIESISSNNEKKLIINLIKYNETHWMFPIILISNNKHTKLIYLIKQILYEIKMDPPTKDIMENILCKICMNENINLNDEIVLSKIIEYSHNDIRGLITILQTIKNIYGNKKFKLNDFEHFIQSCKMKDNDYQIYDGTLKLFYGYDNIDNVNRLFEMEKTVMPLMIQQHYIKALNKHTNINEVNKLSKTIAYGDIIENYIYENNIYDIRDIQSFYQCVYPSYNLTNKLNPKKINYNNFSAKFEYPYDLNKTSIRYINFTKNINPSNKIFKNMNINDYLYLNKMLRGLINSNKLELSNDYLDGYNCSIQILESVLKIDKINGNKYLLTTKLKKKILSECNNINVKVKEQKKYKKNKK